MAKLSSQYIHGLLSRGSDGKNDKRINELIEEFGFFDVCSKEGQNMLYFLAYEGKKYPRSTALIKEALSSSKRHPDELAIKNSECRASQDSMVEKPSQWTPLAAAAKMGNEDAVDILLECGASPFAGHPPAWAFAMDTRVGNISRKILSAMGEEVFSASYKKSLLSPINVAGVILTEGRKDLLDFCPANFDDPGVMIHSLFNGTYAGRYVLHFLAECRSHHSEIFKSLAAKLPADRVWERGKTGRNVFESFVRDGKAATALWIVKKFGLPPVLHNGRNVLFFQESDKSELAFASGNLNLELFKHLVKKGLSPISEEGAPQLLHAAVKKGNVDLLKFLLDIGADPTRLNEQGKTAHDVIADEMAKVRGTKMGSVSVGWEARYEQMESMISASLLMKKAGLSGDKPARAPVKGV